MRKLRTIFHIILSLAILSTGLPLYQRGDINRDGEVGLTDAILSVRQLTGAAGDAVSFREGMENTLTALAVAAGLKSVLREAREPGVDRTFPATPLFIAASVYSLEDYPVIAPCIAGRSFLYHSPALIPESPPPRVSLV